MGKKKVNYSVCFTVYDKEEFFLFQVLNFGKQADELKFIFNDHGCATGGIYTDSPQGYADSDLIRLQPEITYHADGQMHFKLPGYSQDPRTIYKNPKANGSKRIPLKLIEFWEPLIRYTVFNYKLCKKTKPSNPVYIPENNAVFDGTAFACVIFVGNKNNLTPTPRLSEVAFRLPNVGDELDLLVCAYKINEQGQMMTIEGLNEIIWSTNNMIQIVERTRS